MAYFFHQWFLILRLCTINSLHSCQFYLCFCMLNYLFIQLIYILNINDVYFSFLSVSMCFNLLFISKLTFNGNINQVELARQYHFNYTTPDRSRQELLLNRTPLPTEHWPFLRSAAFYLLNKHCWFSNTLIHSYNIACLSESMARTSAFPPQGHQGLRNMPLAFHASSWLT